MEEPQEIKTDGELRAVNEPTVQFKMISDRSKFEVLSEKDTSISLMKISGYDLQIDFNMEYLNSVEDVEAAIDGIGNLFRQIIMDALLKHKQKD